MASMSTSRRHPRADSSFVCEECAVASTKLGSLNTALEDGHHTCLEALLKEGAVKDKGWVDEALIKAVLSEQSKCVEVLIVAGADVNHQDEERRTVLIYAALIGEEKTIGILIAAKADVNHEDIEHCTALIHAVVKGDIKSTELLIDAGADVNHQDEDGMTALIRAALGGHNEIVEFLLKSGAQVNFKAKDGMIALFWQPAKIMMNVSRPSSRQERI